MHALARQTPARPLLGALPGLALVVLTSADCSIFNLERQTAWLQTPSRCPRWLPTALSSLKGPCLPAAHRAWIPASLILLHLNTDQTSKGCMPRPRPPTLSDRQMLSIHHAPTHSLRKWWSWPAPNLDFDKVGVVGLSKETGAVHRRRFSSSRALTLARAVEPPILPPSSDIH